METTGQQTDTQRSGHLLRIAVLALDREYRGNPASIFSWNRTLIKLNILDNVRIERGENSEHMGRIVDGIAIEEDKVLVRCSSPDIESS